MNLSAIVKAMRYEDFKKSNQLSLGELIEILKSLPKDAVMKIGLGAPASYRGYYDELAFAPTENITVEEMLKNAEGAVDRSFCGYKGGDFTMDLSTPVWLASWGDGGKEITKSFFKGIRKPRKKKGKAKTFIEKLSKHMDTVAWSKPNDRHYAWEFSLWSRSEALEEVVQFLRTEFEKTDKTAANYFADKIEERLMGKK